MQTENEKRIDEIAGIMYKHSDYDDDVTWLGGEKFHKVAAQILFYIQNSNSNSQPQSQQTPCKTLLPLDDDFHKELDKVAFRVPYDGSNKFYDETQIKHWKECWEWVKGFKRQ